MEVKKVIDLTNNTGNSTTGIYFLTIQHTHQNMPYLVFVYKSSLERMAGFKLDPKFDHYFNNSKSVYIRNNNRTIGEAIDHLRDIVEEVTGLEVFIPEPNYEAIQRQLVAKANVSAAAELSGTAEKAKRRGKLTQVRTRPDQAKFARMVKENCYDMCVVTGTRLLARCEAAHLLNHGDDGIDHYTNGLLMRADIHALFDADICAIDPATMTIWFSDDALALDPELAQYHIKTLAPTRKPINPEYLQARWEKFKRQSLKVVEEVSN
ncbi:HNH endonuclease [Salmonella enterica subsp. enterica]|nr:HNH endonuclease [Salmonella enterica subsp. enterica]EEJ7209129.1 HNH endonuclease [Salmonella enterica subsp. enterica]